MRKLSNLKLTVGNEALYFDMEEFLGQIYIPNEEDNTKFDINLPKFEFWFRKRYSKTVI